MFFHRCRLATIPYGCSLVMKTLRFTTLPGDGIGPEVMEVALKVLDDLGSKHGFSMKAHPTTPEESESTTTGKPASFHPVRMRTGRCYSFRFGRWPKWENLPPKEQPERAALLLIARHFELFANLRPGNLYPELADLSPLRLQTVANGIDVPLRSRTYRRSLLWPTQAKRDP